MSPPDPESAEAVTDDVIVPLVGGGSSGEAHDAGGAVGGAAAVGAGNANGRLERKISYGDRKFSRKTIWIPWASECDCCYHGKVLLILLKCVGTSVFRTSFQQHKITILDQRLQYEIGTIHSI